MGFQRRRRLLLVTTGALALSLVSCVDEQTTALLAPPAAPEGVTEVTADVSDTLPEALPPCGAALQWEAGTEIQQVVGVPYGTTVVVTGQRNGLPLTLICDYDEDGTLLTGEPLANTGTDQPVGNDYVIRVGEALGRVDIGIPDGAVEATYDLGEWALRYPLHDLSLLRLHALEGGDAWTGYTMGTVTFTDASGADVTPESVPIPDVIHGAPRGDRGSGVGGED